MINFKKWSHNRTRTTHEKSVFMVFEWRKPSYECHNARLMNQHIKTKFMAFKNKQKLHRKHKWQSRNGGRVGSPIIYKLNRPIFYTYKELLQSMIVSLKLWKKNKRKEGGKGERKEGRKEQMAHRKGNINGS